MNTKYGKIAEHVKDTGLEQYINKFFKILPMYEERCPTLQQYIQSLNREMVGFTHLELENVIHKDFLSIISTLESLTVDEITVKEVKTDVFKCISILKKIKGRQS
jgi:hypothetical protein